MRIQKYLSLAGVCSRRKGEKLIFLGRVKINGSMAQIGDIVDEGKDIVLVDDKKVALQEKKIYILLNKPKGYVTTTDDPEGRKTVLDLTSDIKERIYPVGRLDYDSEGLLILTNDGDLANMLTHPKHELEKVYRIKCAGRLSKKDIDLLANGVIIDKNYLTKKANIYEVSALPDYSLAYIGIKEGKNRQLRKMFAVIGYEVLNLKRIKIGFLDLKKLKRGKYRFLTEDEVADLKKIFKRENN